MSSTTIISGAQLSSASDAMTEQSVRIRPMMPMNDSIAAPIVLTSSCQNRHVGIASDCLALVYRRAGTLFDHVNERFLMGRGACPNGRRGTPGYTHVYWPKA